MHDKLHDCRNECKQTVDWDDYHPDLAVRATKLANCYDACENDSFCPAIYVDCSQRGGYDTSDTCRQTCLVDHSDSQTCLYECEELTESITFKDNATRVSYLNQCKSACATPTEVSISSPYNSDEPVEAGEVMCILKYVDCSLLGGYDPEDVCNQTCMIKQTEAEHAACKSQCQIKMGITEFSSVDEEGAFY